ncbi:MAG: ComF family protein [Bifidobacterium pseudocatenulatum]
MDGPSVYKWWHAMWAQVCKICCFHAAALGVTRRMRYCVRHAGPCSRNAGNGMQTVVAEPVYGPHRFIREQVRRAILDWKDHDDHRDLTARSAASWVSLLEQGANTIIMLEVIAYWWFRCHHRGRPNAPKRTMPIRHPLAKSVAGALRGCGVDARPCNALSSSTKARSVQQVSSAQRARRITGHVRVKRDLIGHGDAVLLVDDIVTTGATVRQCVQAFQQAGTEVVGVLVLADAVVRRSDDDING